MSGLTAEALGWASTGDGDDPMIYPSDVPLLTGLRGFMYRRNRNRSSGQGVLRGGIVSVGYLVAVVVRPSVS